MKTLEKYKEKRDFEKTPEPSGKQKPEAGNRFVIHKHDARRTHYDFRIELDGVLVCWAIPKMPVFNTEVKRLAVKTEDHPLDYITFEGIIPKGNYGAGTVIIWDAGRYYLNEDGEIAEIDYLKEKIEKIGHIKIFLRGQKLTGYFNLFRTSKDGDKEQWIFTKTKDQFANMPDPDDEAVKIKGFDQPTENNTVKREITEVTGVEKKEIIPEKIKPMLATLVDKPFDNNDWIFELKLDGYRVISSKIGSEVNLFSRYGNTFNEKYKVIHDALSKIEGDFVIDGEVVILNDEGKTDFQALQNITSADFKKMYYYVFDILWINGYDVKKVPLLDRKLLLKTLISDKVAKIRYCDHIEGRGVDFYNEVVKNNLEGIIAKRKTSTYREGARSDEWLKMKTSLRQEFIICGYTPPQKSRRYFGALLAAVYENGKLVYTGRVGTGFDDNTLKKLYDLMQPLKTDKPVVDAPDSKHVQWVIPELVCEIRFSSWTEDRVMRAASFIGLRTDKSAKEVTLEKPEQKQEKMELPEKVKITNPDKIFWKEKQIKKIDVINYYNDTADIILPYLINRPQSLFRSPNGAEAPGFFQKDVKDKVPDWIETIDVKDDDDKDKEYMLCQNRDTLVYMANMGCIEINPWNSSVPTIDNPDYVVFDLDPVEISFDKVVDVAAQIKFLFDKYELPFFCKTSGSRGIHIYLPVEPVYSYEQGQNFVKLIETIVHQQMKDITSFVRNPNERRGRVYLDFLQNAKGKTMSSVYSLRPKPGAKVSAPVRWQELNKKLNPDDFNIFTMSERIGKYGDIWKDFFKSRIKIEEVLKRMG